MKYWIAFLFAFCFKIAFSQPVITSFSPISGPPGTQVIIRGINFNATNNFVYFGPAKATIVSSANDSITVTVPFGSTYDFISVTTDYQTAQSSEKFLVVMGTGGSMIPSSFGTPQPFVSGNFVFSTAIADFDADGKIDIVSANYSAATISVFRNESSRDLALAGKIDYITSNSVGHVRTGDINGDGKIDIVTSNAEPKTLSVFLNTSTIGNISFSPKQDFPTGKYTLAAVTGDIDGDGKIDLIEINNHDSTVSILRNTSAPGSFTLSFAGRVNFSTGNSPSEVELMDLDEDGKPEILVTNMYSNSVSIYKNNSVAGSILIAPKQDILIGHDPRGITIGDLNNDGKPDIVTGNGDTTISILKNTTTGSSFSFERQDIVIGVTPNSVDLSDIDGDGKPDIASAGSETSISILINSSAGNNISFNPKVNYFIGGSTGVIKIADLNNDGRGDVLLGNSNRIVLVKNKMQVDLYGCQGGNAFIYRDFVGSSYQWQVNTGAGYTNITDDAHYIGSSTQILQITNLPFSWSGYKYRCSIAGVYGTERLLIMQNSWIGNVDNAWENPLNWSCGVIPNETTDVKIDSGSLIISSNVVIRSLQINTAAQLSISAGYNLTILH